MTLVKTVYTKEYNIYIYLSNMNGSTGGEALDVFRKHDWSHNSIYCLQISHRVRVLSVCRLALPFM